MVNDRTEALFFGSPTSFTELFFLNFSTPYLKISFSKLEILSKPIFSTSFIDSLNATTSAVWIVPASNLVGL